jgi:hypothetical protein
MSWICGFGIWVLTADFRLTLQASTSLLSLSLSEGDDKTAAAAGIAGHAGEHERVAAVTPRSI